MSPLAVLVATTRTQGLHGDDFIGCSPDELVDITSSCDNPDPDRACRCCRAFTGLDTRQPTSTAEVVEREMTWSDYVVAHHTSLLRAGLPDNRTVRDWAYQAARDIARIAGAFPVGTVVERRGDDIHERPPVTTAATQ
ncbi:hypothetical protein C8D87_11497 [Lentzea atacamensis]|uniref:DUF7715 domain-containing protein n=1 Tax=Lentzea atacamensis TaxID=531938 RepID=A0ABX9DYB3_9PSEU|nr:hypothetical protein [Lentzea atacamensis]RAS59485.1 hypothetical protein C8D87_11497 [Lentzea atacamensis]